MSVLNQSRKKGKMQKSETDTDPPQGGGERDRKSLLKNISFNYYWLQYQQTKISETSWSLCGMKPRSYNFAKFVNSSERGDPQGDLNAPEDTFEQKIPLFSVTPAKKQ